MGPAAAGLARRKPNLCVALSPEVRSFAIEGGLIGSSRAAVASDAAGSDGERIKRAVAARTPCCPRFAARRRDPRRDEAARDERSRVFRRRREAPAARGARGGATTVLGTWWLARAAMLAGLVVAPTRASRAIRTRTSRERRHQAPSATQRSEAAVQAEARLRRREDREVGDSAPGGATVDGVRGSAPRPCPGCRWAQVDSSSTKSPSSSSSVFSSRSGTPYSSSTPPACRRSLPQMHAAAKWRHLVGVVAAERRRVRPQAKLTIRLRVARTSRSVAPSDRPVQITPFFPGQQGKRLIPKVESRRMSAPRTRARASISRPRLIETARRGVTRRMYHSESAPLSARARRTESARKRNP